MITLHVNIDHIATLRNARGGKDPEPAAAAKIAELAGADGITVHLREDERHINRRDAKVIKEIVQTHFNLEMSCADDIVSFARALAPEQCTLVPERRQELTTEGGLDVNGQFDLVKTVVGLLKESKIVVSLFIAPEEQQIKAAHKAGADFVELHTGAYANALTEDARSAELQKVKDMAQLAERLGLHVNAGHGLNYVNVLPVCLIPQVEQLHIGHSIISRAVLNGLDSAVREMKELTLKGMML